MAITACIAKAEPSRINKLIHFAGTRKGRTAQSQCWQKEGSYKQCSRNKTEHRKSTEQINEMSWMRGKDRHKAETLQYTEEGKQI